MLTEQETERLKDLLSICDDIIQVYGEHLNHLSLEALELWDYFVDEVDDIEASLNDPNRCPKCGETDWDYANIGFTNAITCLHCGSIRMKNEE